MVFNRRIVDNVLVKILAFFASSKLGFVCIWLVIKLKNFMLVILTILSSCSVDVLQLLYNR